MSREATIQIAGIAVPRLVFGLGSLMKWAPNHAHPLLTDSTVEVRQAIAAGFRHFNTGDLYTNNESAANVLRSSGIPREQLFLSLKLNTYAMLGCKGAEHMKEKAKAEIERYGLGGYVDILQLHFPPRGYKGNLTNREAWRVMEELKDEGVARIIGLSNWTLADYPDIMDAPDLKHKPQVNELEFNPFLLFNPASRELHKYEKQHGVVNVNYGFLTVIGGRLPRDQAPALLSVLEDQSQKTGLSPAELLLSWAYDCLQGVVVTSSSNADRVTRTVKLLGPESTPLDRGVYDAIEKAAKEDGFDDSKRFYKHPHMEAAAKQ